MGWLDSLINWVASWFTSSEHKMVVAVREATVKACGFLPTVETVLALIAVNNPAVITATMIAKKICAAVSPMKLKAKMGDSPIIVDGVVIEGEFVGKD